MAVNTTTREGCLVVVATTTTAKAGSLVVVVMGGPDHTGGVPLVDELYAHFTSPVVCHMHMHLA